MCSVPQSLGRSCNPALRERASGEADVLQMVVVKVSLGNLLYTRAARDVDEKWACRFVTGDRLVEELLAVE